MTMLTKEQALRMLMLDDLLPASQIVTDPIELLAYEVDAGMDRGRPTGVVFPKTLKKCHVLCAGRLQMRRRSSPAELAQACPVGR